MYAEPHAEHIDVVFENSIEANSITCLSSVNSIKTLLLSIHVNKFPSELLRKTIFEFLY